jgi:hypothetical protein
MTWLSALIMGVVLNHRRWLSDSVQVELAKLCMVSEIALYQSFLASVGDNARCFKGGL